MLRFTPGELELAVATLIGAVIALAAATVWVLYRQEADIKRQAAELHDLRVAFVRLRDVVFGADDDEPDELPTGPMPLPAEPPTVEAHPVDMWGRKVSLLARYSHPGQHRR